jgi:O-antigen/teichoic acid export membrane protein
MSSDIKNKVINSMKWTILSLIFRDILQFIGMIFMLRYLTPEDYGYSALMQSVIGVIAIFSYNTFSNSIYQKTDRSSINWALELNIAFKINIILFAVSIIIGIFISIYKYKIEYLLMMVLLGSVFLFEIFANIHHRKLEIEHKWARFRIISYVGAVLSIAVAIWMAASDYGVWSILIQPSLFVLPSTIDYFYCNKLKINKNYKIIEYVNELKFGLGKVIGIAISKLKYFLEQLAISNIYSYADLGILNRTQGLSNILIARLGGILVVPLTPSITELKADSLIFSNLVKNIISIAMIFNIILCYTIIINGEFIIDMIYGDKWRDINLYLLKFSILAVFTSIASIINMVYTYTLGIYRLSKIESGYGLIQVLAVIAIFSSIDHYLNLCILVQSLYFFNSLLILHIKKFINIVAIGKKILPIIMGLILHYIITINSTLLERFFYEVIILILALFIMYKKLFLSINIGSLLKND